MAARVATFALADIMDTTARRIEHVKLPTEVFSMLTQVRKTYEIDHDLVPSMLARGQLTPGMVAALSPEQAEIYIQHINMIYGSVHTMDDLTLVLLDSVPYYLIIFAGHRRYLTKHYINEGIEGGMYVPTEYYDEWYRAMLFFDISAEEAIELQFHENRHTAPPLHEEADAAWRFLRYKRINDPKLTISAFAKSIGRRPEWVSNALRFCNLPASIQSYVTGDNAVGARLPFGTLVNLARLADNYKLITGEDLGEAAMHLWLRQAVANRLDTTAFGRRINEYLEQKRLEAAGQGSLLGFAPPQEEQERHLRRTVAKEMVRGLWLALEYARQVQRLQRGGVLGHKSYLGPYLTQEDQEVFSPRSPIRVWAELLEIVSELSPELAELSRKERTGHFRRLLKGHPLLDNAATALKYFASIEAQAANGAPN